jgi:hypothetical protein
MPISPKRSRGRGRPAGHSKNDFYVESFSARRLRHEVIE